MPFLTQLLSYGPWWLAFAAITYGTARFSFWWCIPMAHFTVAALIFFLDVRWIRMEMNRPDWNGSPDMDIVFTIGVVIRILLVNTILLSLTALGVWQRKRDRIPPAV